MDLFPQGQQTSAIEFLEIREFTESEIFERTELWITLSRAKFDEEADFEVRLILNPQNPDEKSKKLFLRTESFRQIFFSASKN